jgi:hypothetical protein
MRRSSLFAAVVDYFLFAAQLSILIFVVVRTNKRLCPANGWYNSINTRNPLFYLHIATMVFSIVTSLMAALTSHLTFDQTSNPQLFCSVFQHFTILSYVFSSFCVYLFLLYRSKTVKSSFTSSYSKLENVLSFALVLVVALLGYVMYALVGSFIILSDGTPYCTFFVQDFVYICFGVLDVFLNVGFLLLFYLPLRSMASDTSQGMEPEIQAAIRKNLMVCIVTVAFSIAALACSSQDGDIGTYLAFVPCLYLVATSISLQWCTSAAWVKLGGAPAAEQKSEVVAI